MNVERLLRELEKRLASAPEAVRNEVLDATREEIAKERRRREPSLTVEAERERRVEAETLREVLEAINREARLESTIEEVLKQLGRIVSFDGCSLTLAEPSGLRTLVVRGVLDGAAARVEVPLLVEGTRIGTLALARLQDDAFSDEDLHRTRAVAFSASAAIQKARLLERVRRYAALMERVVTVDQAVFAGASPDEVAQSILDGAVQIGRYAGGLLSIRRDGSAVFAATSGEGLGSARGRLSPNLLEPDTTTRVPRNAAAGAASSLALSFPPAELYVVPLATPSVRVGTLVLFDPDGATVDDLLMESFASRAAAAYLHAARPR
jgi:hypothetical protein